jgi:hypothetical protein
MAERKPSKKSQSRSPKMETDAAETAAPVAAPKKASGPRKSAHHGHHAAHAPPAKKAKAAKPAKEPKASKAPKSKEPAVPPPSHNGDAAKPAKKGFFASLFGRPDTPAKAAPAPEPEVPSPAESIPEPVLSKQRRASARAISIDDAPEPEPAALPEAMPEPTPGPTPEPAAEAEEVFSPEEGLLPETFHAEQVVPEPAPAPEAEAAPEAEPEPLPPEPVAAAPTPAPTTEEDWAALIAKARRKPVHISDSGAQTETLRVEAPKPVLHDERAAAAAAARTPAPPVHLGRPPVSADGLTLPEQYLLIAITEGWDDRQEKFRVGSHGPALVGALILDVALRGHLKIQRDRFEVVDGGELDPDLAPVVKRLRELKDAPSMEAMRRLGAGDLTGLIRPWKQRLARRGLVTERTWKHMGLFKRSETDLRAPDAQAKLENRLVRLLSGGTADAQTICLLGLIDAAGLLPNLVPSSALPFNRSRIQGLVTGRDKLGYLVDRDFKGMQEVLVTTILTNVKKAQRGQ